MSVSGEVTPPVTPPVTTPVTGEVTGEHVKTDHDTDYDTDHDTDHVDKLTFRIVSLLINDMNRSELMNILGLKHSANFRENYLHPAIKQGLIEMTIPEKPKSKNQKYRLTEKGKKLKRKLN